MKMPTFAVSTRLSLLALFLTAGCSKTDNGVAGDHAASDAHDAHGIDQSAVLAPPEGQRWATDEPLREAMERLRASVEKQLAAQEEGSIDAAGSQALAQTVEREVAYMIENCRLPPKPDAALHVLIARMLSAAHDLKESRNDAQAASELARILNTYGEHFDHPGWTALSEDG